jgi:hypothetical protein
MASPSRNGKNNTSTSIPSKCFTQQYLHLIKCNTAEENIFKSMSKIIIKKNSLIKKDVPFRIYKYFCVSGSH